MKLNDLVDALAAEIELTLPQLQHCLDALATMEVDDPALLDRLDEYSGLAQRMGEAAELALAGCAAYLLDDAAAPLTDVAPQGRWRRRAPTLTTGVLVIAGAWLGVLTLLR